MCSTLLLVITGDLYLPAPVCSSSLQYKEGLQTDVGRYKSPVLVIMDTVPNIDESYSIAPPPSHLGTGRRQKSVTNKALC